MKAEDLDQKFDNGEEVLEYFDLSTLKRPGLKVKRVNVDLPQWMITALDKEAKRLGIHRQKVEMTTVKTEVSQLKSDVSDLKSSQKAQIWSLIVLAFTSVVGLFGIMGKLLFFS